jgi:hypothetical protein
MTPRHLPPLQAGTVYRTREFEYFEFEARSLHKTLTGEDTAILRLHLGNGTKLDIPVTDENLSHLMRNLIAAFPADAVAFVKSQPWAKRQLEQDDGQS